MARIGKYVLGIVLLAAVAAAAVYLAREVDLLAGALVVLGALIALTLAVRFSAARAEKSAMKDWKDVLAADAPDDAFFSDWALADAERSAHAADTDIVIEAHTAAGLESLDDLLAPIQPRTEPTEPSSSPEPDVAPAADPTATPAIDAGATPATEAAPAGSADDHFPFDDPSDDWGDLPPLIRPRPNPVADPAAETPAELTAAEPGPDLVAEIPPAERAPDPIADVTPVETPGDEAPATLDPSPAEPAVPATDGRGANGRDANGSDPDGHEADGALERREADTYSLAGVGRPATNGTSVRRSVIDWTGPVHAVEAQVRTSDDILAASAATALPVPADRPQPTGGSELARLLAKVETRLRDYE